jgi:NAD(P)-dependent dehydrogenase (short-subunit alcohol dehydrogenase family)
VESSPYTLVSGASSAIGSAIAARISTSRRLILHGRDPERLARCREQCSRPAEHLLWTHDLSDVTSIAAGLGAQIALAGTPIEGFVHCAGTLLLGAFRLARPDQEMALFAVNVFSAIEIVRVLRRQTPNRAALTRVVLISSAASRVGEKGNALYTASKGALDAFMRSAAIELAPKCRVNSILPGMVEGGMSEGAAKVQENYPLGIGRPDDVAAAAAFLMSEAAPWITGQQLVVDGGYSAHCNHL